MLYLYCILILICNPIFSKAEISNLRKCADPLCSVKIAEGRTTQRYLPNDKGILGCKIDEKVTIYSKDAGTNNQLWGVEINGKRGYLPAKFIKEEKIYMKTLPHMVPMKSFSSDTNASDNLGGQEFKQDVSPSNDDGSSSNSQNELPQEEIALDSVLLNLEDMEFDSIKNIVKEEPPSVVPSEEIKENDPNSEIKITVTKSETQTNTAPQTLKNEAEGLLDESSSDNSQSKEQKDEAVNPIKDNQIINSEINSKENNDISNNNNNNEKINLDIKTNEVKNEEMDNDEGNGNDGEDNGSEYVIGGSSVKGEVKDSTVVIENKIVSPESKDLPNVIEESAGEIKIAASASTGEIPQAISSDSVLLQPNIVASELDKKSVESPVSDEAQRSTPQPTPPQYQMFDGTAIPVEESELYQSYSQPGVQDTHSLEASSVVINDGPSAQRTLPITKLPGGPLLMKNKFAEVKNANSQTSKVKSAEFVSQTSILNADSESQPNLKLSSEGSTDAKKITQKAEYLEVGTSEESKNSNEHQTAGLLINETLQQDLGTNLDHKEAILLKQQNVDGAQSEQTEEQAEFSTPKPETVFEDEIQNLNFDSKSQSESLDGSQSKVEGTDNIGGSDAQLENTESFDYVVNTESNENQVKASESAGSSDVDIEMEMKFVDIPENEVSSEPETAAVESDGLLSSFTNTFSFFKGGSEKDEDDKDDVEKKTDKRESEDKEELKDHQSTDYEYDIDQQKFEDIIDQHTSEENEGIDQHTAEDKDERTDQHTSEDKGIANQQRPFEGENLSIENIPFVDPDTTPLKDENHEREAAHNEEKDQALSKESQDDIHTDDVEEGGIFSFKKKLLHASESVMNEGMVLALEGELADPHLSTGTVIFLLVVAGTIVVLYLSHMIMVKISRESPLLESMNKLDRHQRVLLEENNNLKRKLTDKNGQIKSAKNVDPAAMQQFRQQFEASQTKLLKEMDDLRERNQQLEADLEASTADESELHRMLDELMSNQRETTDFEVSLNSLQSMLDGQREIVEGLTSDLALKTRLNEELRNELKVNKSKLSKLEYQIEQLTQSLEEVNTTKHDLMKRFSDEELNAVALKDMNDTLRQEVDKMSTESQNYYKEKQKLLQEVRKLKQKVHNKEAECQISKECLKKLQILADGGGNDSNGKLTEIFKIIEVKTQLASAMNERDTLQSKMDENERMISSQSEDLKNIRYENNHLKETSNTLQKERDDAVSKLQVLSKYYEERETQLKKTLESQEGLLQSAEGSANVVSNRIQAYELELNSCRSQVESLKVELEEQKQSYKLQLANEEKKLHDTWLTARAAERRQEELRQENTQLRQTLTHIQRDSEHKNMLNKSASKRIDANGSVSSPIHLENDVASMHPGLPPLDLDGSLPHHLPPPMMFPGRPPLPPPPPGLPPLPPHMFGPLPPPPPMPDRRLPPAGRIASPPGYDRRSYSPESDRSRYSDHRYSPGPPRYSPNNHRGHSPDRRSDHMRRNMPLRRNQRSPSPSLRRNQRSPSPLDPRQRHSPRERWYNHSPPHGLAKNHRSPPLDYYDHQDNNSRTSSGKGKKTSTPLGPNDR